VLKVLTAKYVLRCWLLIPSGMTPEVVSAEGINNQVLRCWLLIPSTMTPEEITEGINSQAPTEVQNMIIIISLYVY
jgi:hypothetical protein